jgi:hypothetical protein
MPDASGPVRVSFEWSEEDGKNMAMRCGNFWFDNIRDALLCVEWCRQIARSNITPWKFTRIQIWGIQHAEN